MYFKRVRPRPCGRCSSSSLYWSSLFQLKPLTLSDLGSIASLISLVLTGIIYWNVRDIRRGVLYKARAPELRAALGQQKSSLNTYLTNFPSSSVDYHRQLPALESILLALEDKVGGLWSKHRRSVRDVRKLVAQQRAMSPNEGGAEEIYSQLTFLIETLEQDWRDREWRI